MDQYSILMEGCLGTMSEGQQLTALCAGVRTQSPGQ